MTAPENQSTEYCKNRVILYGMELWEGMARKASKEIRGLREHRQKRRMEAGALFAQGVSRAEVSVRLGVTWKSANEWCKSGQEALKSKGKPGPVPKFDEGHRGRLAELLLRGPRSFGYDNVSVVSVTLSVSVKPGTVKDRWRTRAVAKGYGSYGSGQKSWDHEAGCSGTCELHAGAA